MKYIPHPYQAYAESRIVSDPAVGLFLDMGLGKTVITLSAVSELKYSRFQVRKCLVIAPKKVAEATWSREAKKWDHTEFLRVIPVLGSAAKRVRAVNTPGDVYVINRENVPWLVEYYRNSWPFDMVVVDESTSFKNHKAKRFRALTWVLPHIRRIVLLTGTPAPNGLLDLWSQVFLLDRGERLGKTFGGFRERYFLPDQRNAQQVFSYRPKRDAENEIRRRIADICISMTAEDYLQLPPLTYDDIPVVLDDEARRRYDTMERDLVLNLDEATIDAASAAALSGKLQQLCNGAVYDGSGSVVPVHDCKLEAFVELIDALQGQPALVFYSFRHDADRIERVLDGTGLRVRRLTADKDAAAWNNREVDVLLAHPASAAYGLNLQEGGNHVVWFGLNWSLELYQQANKRLHRQGQRERVIVHHLIVAGGRDEDILNAIQCKGDAQDELIQSLKVRIARVKEEENAD